MKEKINGNPVNMNEVEPRFTKVINHTTPDVLSDVKEKMVELIVGGDWVQVEGNVKNTYNLIANYVAHDYIDDILVYNFADFKARMVFLRKNMYFMNVLAGTMPGDQRLNAYSIVITDDGNMRAAWSVNREHKIKHVETIIRKIERLLEDYRLTPSNHAKYEIVLGFRGNDITIIRPNVEKYSTNMKIKVLNDALKRLKKYRKEIVK